MKQIKYEITYLSVYDKKLGLKLGDVVVRTTSHGSNAKTVCCALPDRLKGLGHVGAVRNGVANYWYFDINQLRVVKNHVA